MASTAETRLARHAGTAALIRTVTRAKSAQIARMTGFTVMVLRPVPANASWSISMPMPSPATLNTTKVPKMPRISPTGMPIAASMRASA